MTTLLTAQNGFYKRIVRNLLQTIITLQATSKKFYIATVADGKLKGTVECDAYGTSFLSFVGIPYAKPPIGELRFKPPQPPPKWEGIRDATKQGNRCYSKPLVTKLSLKTLFALRETGSEDCLILNVFTRQLCKNENQLRPVMVFIHGGAFILGSSDKAVTGPEFLMTEDIVLVTLNYRLGALGFLAFDDPSLEATGNAALKDQVLALKWVQENIQVFNGDPNNVTIFGQSAGAACVHFLVFSPKAKGLFHKAIIQSGSALSHWTRGENDARKFARHLGCKETDWAKILGFLQKVPVDKLHKTQTKLGTAISEPIKNDLAPTIEPKTDTAFLYQEPIDLLCSGDYNRVPLMFGYTSGEGAFIAHGKKLGMKTNFEHFVPYYLGYEKGSPQYQDLNKKIKLFYFGTEKPDVSKPELFYDIFTDNVFLKGIHFAVEAHAKTSQQPVYYYRVSINTEMSMFKKLLQIKSKKVCHADELVYLFKIEDNMFRPETMEELLVLRFVKMWTNFARTGNPIPEKTCILDVDWKPVGDKMHFLDIGCRLEPGVDPEADRMKFWENVYKGANICF